jgi:hypothetical protein
MLGLTSRGMPWSERVLGCRLDSDVSLVEWLKMCFFVYYFV